MTSELRIIRKLNKLAETCSNMTELYGGLSAGFILLASNNWR